jgi:hypothetical protein
MGGSLMPSRIDLRVFFSLCDVEGVSFQERCLILEIYADRRIDLPLMREELEKVRESYAR